MSPWERLAGIGPAASRSPHVPLSTPVAPELTKRSWESLYELLPSDARAQLLAAAEQGVLPAVRIPHPLPDPPRNLLQRLLLGESPEELPPLDPPTLASGPLPPDPAQHAAIELALATPDVALIQGLPGTGKSTVIAQILDRAIAAGERVLLLAHSPAALDRVLERLADHPHVCPLRCLGKHENAEHLAPLAADCTLAGHARRFEVDARLAIDRKLRDAETRAARRARDREILERCEACWTVPAASLATARARNGHETLAPAPSPDRDARVAALQAQIAELQPAGTAARERSWWPLTWLRSRALDHRAARVHDLEQQLRSLLEEPEDPQAFAPSARCTCGHGQDASEPAREWEAWTAELSADLPRPAPGDADALALTRQALQSAERDEQVEHERWRAWSMALTDLVRDFAHRWPEQVNLVAATPASLAAERGLANSTRLFDRLVFDEAHLASESDLLGGSRRARVSIFVGEPPAGRDTHRKGENGEADAPRGRGRSGRAALGAFARLWQALHVEPWGREGDRLLCRLRGVPPRLRPTLLRETVLDRPDIELRILAPAGQLAQLAEVVFPAGTSLVDAKNYLVQQIDEVPLASIPRHARWIEENGWLRLEVPTGGNRPTHAVPLAEGVRERIEEPAHGPLGLTAGFEFDLQAGWTRERAADWVREHLRKHPAQRTVRLDQPHRMTPALAGVIGDLLGGGGYAHAHPGHDADAVTFLAIPEVSEPGEPARPCAGLEIDLADGHQRAHLPAEWQALLPDCGCVNPPEARAVAALVPTLPAEESLAILALSQAQADLIRLLLGESGRAASLVIGTPEALRQRDADTVIVSLVRSSPRGAVSYGEQPDALPLAISRARKRLILVGDPRALSARADWNGPLDDRDHDQSRHERDLVHHLVGYLAGRGRHPRAFHVRRGGPS